MSRNDDRRPATAMTRFEAGPASATSASPRRPPRSMFGLTGVGFAQPKKNAPPDMRAEMTSMSAPSGSKWTTGLRVRRPNSLAVPSPSR